MWHRLLNALGLGHYAESPGPALFPIPPARRVSTQEEAIVEAQLRLMSWVTPAAPPELMEHAMRLAFADVPGFDGSYKDSICVDGRWRDVVRDYQQPGAFWQGPIDGGLA